MNPTSEPLPHEPHATSPDTQMNPRAQHQPKTPTTYDRRDAGPTGRTYLNKKTPNELHTPLAPECTDGDTCRRQTHILGR